MFQAWAGNYESSTTRLFEVNEKAIETKSVILLKGCFQKMSLLGRHLKRLPDKKPAVKEQQLRQAKIAGSLGKFPLAVLAEKSFELLERTFWGKAIASDSKTETTLAVCLFLI